MEDKIGRNDPCPCGSGKKYKKCCLISLQGKRNQQHISPKFSFEPGSYGDVGNFTPSISCLKQAGPDVWDYHFVLVKPQVTFHEEGDASSAAEKDLELAFNHKKQVGSDYGIADYLKVEGYHSVSDFNIVKS